MLRRGLESLSEVFGAEAEDVSRRGTDLFNSNLNAVAKRYETLRSAQSDGISYPNALLLSEVEAEEFFVSVATFYANQAPISAFVHVVDGQVAEFLYTKNKRPKSERIEGRATLASLGACVGETYLAALNSAESGQAPSYAACKRSLSFVLARAAAIHPSCDPDLVLERWIRLRKLTGLEVSESSVNAIREIHRLIFANARNKLEVNEVSKLFNSIGQYINGSLSTSELVNVLVRSYPQTLDTLKEMSGPFDGRMKGFLALVELVQASSLGSDADSLAVGFLCNLILPGSFAHSKVLTRIISQFPSALIWYGFFSTLSKEFLPNQFNSGIVAKLIRDVNQAFSIEDRPRCDIALGELEVLSRLPIRPEVIKSTLPKIALVSLLPGVDVASRFIADEEHANERDARPSEVSEIADRLTFILEDALYALKRTKHQFSAKNRRR